MSAIPEGPRHASTAVPRPECRGSRGQSPRLVLPDASVCTGDADTQALLPRSRAFSVRSDSLRSSAWLSDALHRFLGVEKALESLLSDGCKQRESAARSGCDQDGPSPVPASRGRGQPGGLTGDSAQRRPPPGSGSQRRGGPRWPRCPPGHRRLRGVAPCAHHRPLAGGGLSSLRSLSFPFPVQTQPCFS